MAARRNKIFQEGDVVYALVSTRNSTDFVSTAWFWAAVPGTVLNVERAGHGVHEGEYQYLLGHPSIRPFGRYNRVWAVDVFATVQEAAKELARRTQMQAERLLSVGRQRRATAKRGARV